MDPQDREPAHSDREYYQSLGPWCDELQAAKYLGIPRKQIRERAQEGALLGVQFADELFYFPVWQFVDGTVIEGFPEILRILRSAFPAPETCIAWFTEAAYESETTRRIDVLRAGRADLVTS